MNIAFVNSTHKWGGVKTWMLDFGAELAKRGHLVRVYARQPQYVSEAQRLVGHGESVNFGGDLNPFAIRAFCARFRRDRIQAVFVNVEKDLATAGVAAKLCGIPVIQFLGLPNDIPHRLKTRLLHRWIHPIFLSPCRYIAEGFAKSLPYLDGFRSDVIMDGKHADNTPLEAHTPRQLLATQQLNADKRHETLLRALAQLPAPGTDGMRAWHFNIVGTGSEVERLQALAVELKVRDRVSFHGFSTDIPGHIRRSDIFLLASQAEGLPNTQLEAMAGGLLPIMRDVGGVREACPPDWDEDRFPPLLVPYESEAEAFAVAIEKALRLSDAEMLAARTRIRDYFQAHFDLGLLGGELEAWLQDVIREKRA